MVGSSSTHRCPPSLARLSARRRPLCPPPSSPFPACRRASPTQPVRRRGRRAGRRIVRLRTEGCTILLAVRRPLSPASIRLCSRESPSAQQERRICRQRGGVIQLILPDFLPSRSTAPFLPISHRFACLAVADSLTHRAAGGSPFLFNIGPFTLPCHRAGHDELVSDWETRQERRCMTRPSDQGRMASRPRERRRRFPATSPLRYATMRRDRFAGAGERRLVPDGEPFRILNCPKTSGDRQGHDR